MEELLSLDRLRAIWDTVYGWLLSNVFVLGNALRLRRFQAPMADASHAAH